MIYKRKGEETVKQCENWTCQTVWKDSWLERWQHENVCPMCGTEFKEGEVKVLEPIKNKPKDKLYYLRMKEAKYKEQLEIAQCRAIQLENTPIEHASVRVFQGQKTHHESFQALAARHGRDLGELARMRTKCVSLKLILSDLNGQMDKFSVILAPREENK